MSDDKNKPDNDSKEKATDAKASVVKSKPEQEKDNNNVSATSANSETSTQNKKTNLETPKADSKASKSSDNLFSSKTAPKLQPPQKQNYRSGTNIKPLPLIAVILSITAIVGIAWSAYNQYQMQQNFEQLQTELKQQSDTQIQLGQTSSRTAQASLQTANGNQQIINQQSLLIQQLGQALTATQQRVRELSGRQKQDWLLAEAEYLINLAQLKITLEKDKFTAIALLKTADQRILETADNSLLELRQMIAKDITDLQLVVAPDISGIASQLNAISSQIPQLTLIALEFAPLEDVAKSSEQTTEEFSWRATYQNFLTDFVTIKDHSQPVKPLMTAKQRGNLNNNIQLALQQAQIALVRGEQRLYEMNLNNAFKWIGEFFQHNQTSQEILEMLTQVSGTSINIQLPGELKAKQSIQAINQQRLYQWLENKPQQDEETDAEAISTETTGDQL